MHTGWEKPEGTGEKRPSPPLAGPEEQQGLGEGSDVGLGANSTPGAGDKRILGAVREGLETTDPNQPSFKANPNLGDTTCQELARAGLPCPGFLRAARL